MNEVLSAEEARQRAELRRCVATLAEQLEAAARTDAVRRALIDERTHTSYVTPKAPTDAYNMRTDDVIASLNVRIMNAARKITILAPTHTEDDWQFCPRDGQPTERVNK